MELIEKIDINHLPLSSKLVVGNEVLNLIKDRLGNDILWYYDEESKELYLLTKLTSFTQSLKGLGKEIWQTEGGTERYIKEERSSWER